jgi:hypothetical protein
MSAISIENAEFFDKIEEAYTVKLQELVDSVGQSLFDTDTDTSLSDFLEKSDMSSDAFYDLSEAAYKSGVTVTQLTAYFGEFGVSLTEGLEAIQGLTDYVEKRGILDALNTEVLGEEELLPDFLEKSSLTAGAFKELITAAFEAGISVDQFTSWFSQFGYEFDEGTDIIREAIAEHQEIMDEAKSNYISVLEETYGALESAYDTAKSELESVIDKEQELIDARRDAVKSIDEFILGLQGSTKSPVQSLEFFEKRYEQLLKEAKTASPEDLPGAVSNLTGFTSEYLDFAGAYGGDNYNELFNKITGDLTEFGGHIENEASEEQKILNDIKNKLGWADTVLPNLKTAFDNYVQAESALDEAQWMTDELNKLGNINDSLGKEGDLYALMKNYYDLIGKDIPENIPPKTDTTYNPETGVLTTITTNPDGSSSGSGLGQPVTDNRKWGPAWTEEKAIEVMRVIGKSNFPNSSISESTFDNIAVSAYRSWLELDPELAKKYRQPLDKSYEVLGYADGGIASGPMSGYPVMLHGTEAIIPLNSGSIPVQIQSGNQDIKIVVKIGDKEIKDITYDVIRTDAPTQHQIKRVANG